MSRSPSKDDTRFTDVHIRLTWADSRMYASDGIAIALLCALTVVFYRQIALTDLILPGVDAFTYFYPYRAYAAEIVRSGQIPLWNPYLFLGVPFLGNPQTAVFYPLNLALCWLSGPRLVTWSIVLHTALAALFAYLYARRALGLSPLPGFLSASAFAFGGFLSGQIEHINQLNVFVWFPLLLLLFHGCTHPRGRSRTRATRSLHWPALLGMGAVVGVGMLAGHAQSSYISLVGLGIYALLPLRRFGSTLLRLGVVVLVGLGLAAVQIAPTIELSRLSMRGGGLGYQEAVAFSLRPMPRLLRYTFLPPWGGNLAELFGGDFFTEYLAYVGVVPLLLVAGVLGGWVVLMLCVCGWLGGKESLRETNVRGSGLPLLILAGSGVFLALGRYNPFYFVLYKVVPGFALFRVPARWLFLYAFGAAMLSGVGLEQLGCWLERQGAKGKESHLPRKWARAAVEAGIVAVALLELFAASQALPLNRLTAPEAYTALRTAPAHLLAAQGQEITPGRFLSMSDILFDPGDLGEIEHMFQGQLPERAIYDYVVCTKRKEILAPNLPLAWRVYAVDGYDGGVLPLVRYVRLQHLFLEEDAEVGRPSISPDGRLRETLDRIPPSRLLSLLGVRYVITDKVHDVWIDDVFYDLALDAVLGYGASGSVASENTPRFAATSLGVVSYLERAPSMASLADGTPVAEVRLTTEEGETHTFVLRAGQETAAQMEGQPGHATRLRWGPPAAQIARVEIAALPFAGRIHIRGLTLIDERDGSNVPLLLSTDGRFRQVHSGDVKIYEVLDALPRAYIVHRTQVISDDEVAIAVMTDSAFDPAQEAILSSGQEIDISPRTTPQVTVTTYAPETIALQASLQAPGYLVLSDAWYPGWKATVDGEPMPIERANVHFRALYLDKGTHTVHMTYRPASYFLGVGISLATLIGVGIGLAIKKWGKRTQNARRTQNVRSTKATKGGTQVRKARTGH